MALAIIVEGRPSAAAVGSRGNLTPHFDRKPPDTRFVPAKIGGHTDQSARCTEAHCARIIPGAGISFNCPRYGPFRPSLLVLDEA